MYNLCVRNDGCAVFRTTPTSTQAERQEQHRQAHFIQSKLI